MFSKAYPAEDWTETPCAPAPTPDQEPRFTVGGTKNDVIAYAGTSPGYIWQVQGTFTPYNVTSEHDYASGTPDEYSIQF